MRTKLFVIVLLSLFGQLSNAEEVTFNFEGEIDYQHGTDSDLHTLLPVGQTFTGSVTFDPGTPTTGSSNELRYDGAISNFTVSFETLYATLDNGNLALINDDSAIPKIQILIFSTFILSRGEQITPLFRPMLIRI